MNKDFSKKSFFCKVSSNGLRYARIEQVKLVEDKLKILQQMLQDF